MSITCPACNAVGSSEARFCPACGHALSEQPPRPALETSSTATDAPKTTSLIDHMDGLLGSPTAEWEIIADEPTSAAKVFWQFGAAMALLAPSSMIGEYVFFGRYKHPPESHLLVLCAGLIAFLFQLFFNLYLAYSAAGLSRLYKSPSSIRQAMKVSTYGQMPSFFAFLTNLFPSRDGAFGWIALLITAVGFVWTTFLMQKGAVAVLNIPRNKAIVFSILLQLSVVPAIAVIALVGGVLAYVLGIDLGPVARLLHF